MINQRVQEAVEGMAAYDLWPLVCASARTVAAHLKERYIESFVSTLCGVSNTLCLGTASDGVNSPHTGRLPRQVRVLSVANERSLQGSTEATPSLLLVDDNGSTVFWALQDTICQRASTDGVCF